MMTELEKNLIFKVANGSPEHFPMIHLLHVKFKRGLLILQYCVNTRLVGDSFKQLCQDKGGNWLLVGNEILKRMDKEKNQRSLSKKEMKW